MALVLCAVFLLSGAAGILFETVWFRAMGLTLGSSVWSSSIVLAGFMGGLAAGNAIAARWGKAVRRPLQLYAAAEAVAAIAGIAIVVVLPVFGPSLGRLFRQVVAQAWLLNLLRLTVAFAMMLVPATAMGLTLPVLARATSTQDANFGRVLGRLYGWNTLGGMLGALCGELWLIAWLGQTGTALIAGGLNMVAGGTALALARRMGPSAPAAPEPPGARSRNPRTWSLLAAAFLAGATLLALEAVWFRFLQLFVYGTSFIFAAMLAVILLGIGVGGVVTARWLGRDPSAHRFAGPVALTAGIAVALSYAAFAPRVGSAAYATGNLASASVMFLRLMLPVSLLSGVLFTLLGAAQRRECGEAAEAAGKLTLANTLGAMVGACLAGFVLLPRLGIEQALFAAMLGYGLVAGLCMLVSAATTPAGQGQDVVRPRVRAGLRGVPAATCALFAVAVMLYPFGLMKRRFVPSVITRYDGGSAQLVAAREGLNETVMYLRESLQGRPLYHRLMTNGHSMSATTFRGRRYMKLYVYWALAFNSNARKALLVSYGIGTTAKALTDTRQLESIDVVDISRDILELAGSAFPDGSSPLDDARVRVYVEDGRFFLQTTDEKYDLITSEPPPLRGAGVTSLYSREYFHLIRDHLRDGGVVTYWLPVNQLWLSETTAIMRGFCAAFPDCSLWSGAGLQWMLAGTRNARGPVSEEEFAAQWRDPVVAPELAALGFEAPEALAATFLADATTIGDWARGAAPLDDDHPGRILPRHPPDENGDPIYRKWMDPTAVRERFRSSAFIRDHVPPALRQRAVASFPAQVMLDDLCAWGHLNRIVALHAVLTHSSLHTLPLLLMGTEPAVQRIAVPAYLAGARGAELELEIGARAMSERDYETAAAHLALVAEGPKLTQASLLRALALGLLGRPVEARASLASIDRSSLSPSDAQSVSWLDRFVKGSGEERAD